METRQELHEIISIPYPDEPGVLKCTRAEFDALVRDLGFPAVEYLCQQLEAYSEDEPRKFKKYKNHARVIRKWHEMKIGNGLVFSPSYGHYVKRWLAQERGEV